MRLYDVDEGKILADGRDIRSYDVQKYRDSIGTVFQDFQIFAGSVKENVLLDVADGCSEKEIRGPCGQRIDGTCGWNGKGA